MEADIRGVRYDGSFRIPQGGIAYPSRPGNSSISAFPVLCGNDTSIKEQFPSWSRIVRANMFSRNLSQLYTHEDYDDAEHKDTFNPFFMSTNGATAATIDQKKYHFNMKKREAYLNLLMCLQTKDSATLNTIVETKNSFKELMTALCDTYTTKEPAKVPLLLSNMSRIAPLATWRQLPELIGELEKLFSELANCGSAKNEKEKLETFLSIINKDMLEEYKFACQWQFTKSPESYVDMKEALMIEYSRLLSQQGDNVSTPRIAAYGYGRGFSNQKGKGKGRGYNNSKGKGKGKGKSRFKGHGRGRPSFGRGRGYNSSQSSHYQPQQQHQHQIVRLDNNIRDFDSRQCHNCNAWGHLSGVCEAAWKNYENSKTRISSHHEVSHESDTAPWSQQETTQYPDINTLWNDDKRRRISSLSLQMNSIYGNRATWEEFENFCCKCTSRGQVPCLIDSGAEISAMKSAMFMTASAQTTENLRAFSGQTVQTNGKGNYKVDVTTKDGKRAMVSGSAHIVPDLDYDIISESDLEKHSWRRGDSQTGTPSFIHSVSNCIMPLKTFKNTKWVAIKEHQPWLQVRKK